VLLYPYKSNGMAYHQVHGPIILLVRDQVLVSVGLHVRSSTLAKQLGP
jgi:hypothetical protein